MAFRLCLNPMPDHSSFGGGLPKQALRAVKEEVSESPDSESTHDSQTTPVSSNKLVLVRGGSGHLVVVSLLNRNIKSRLLLRHPEKATALFGEQDEETLQVCKGDTQNPKDLDPSLFEGVTRVICCSGTTAFPSKRWDGDNSSERVDWEGVRNLIPALPKSVKRVVLVSSIGVTKFNELPWSIMNLFGVLKYKKMAEDFLRNSGLPYTIIRLTDGPYTSYDLNTLLKATAGERHAVIIGQGDKLVGEASRIVVAEACIQALGIEFTEGKAYEINSIEERFTTMTSIDDKVELQMLSFEAPKIRLLHSLSIETETMQVLDFGVFPKPEYDVPIFCANFFTSGNTNIILVDLNPLHDVITRRDYKEKYYKGLMPLGVKYTGFLPWGGKLTSESLKFFSPIVLWTKFTSSQYNHDVLFSAFMDYYKAWLQLMKEATVDADLSGFICNREAQHRYLTWRAEKDPGHGVLKKLVGKTHTEDLLKNFLFNGVDRLGSKSFLDYFPEYRCEDGTVNERQSMVGKSFESRPWDMNGEFIGKLG